MKLKKSPHISIDWVDIKVYKGVGIHTPTQAYTEGELYSETKDYFIIRNPETILFTSAGPKNHPERKANFYCIPKTLVKKISHHGK
jgi:hypothetical protein